MIPDASLVTRARDGDRQAFDLLKARHEARILAVFYSVNREDAQDLMLASFIKAWVHIQRFNEQSNFSTWLYRIALNTRCDYYRTHRIDVQLDETHNEIPDTQPALDTRCIANEQVETLHRAISSLSPKLRRVVRLCELQGLRYEDAAKVLNVPEGTVKSRLYRAKVELRKMLGC
jgi:RNA polymerase sigma-70 factor (ECF subfamily)